MFMNVNCISIYLVSIYYSLEVYLFKREFTVNKQVFFFHFTCPKHYIQQFYWQYEKLDVDTLINTALCTYY